MPDETVLMSERFEPWPDCFADAKAQQIMLREQVILEDRLDLDNIQTVAGVDVAFRDDGKVTFAAVVLMRYPSCELLQQVTAELPTTFPYVPGYLSFRELPAIVAAWQKLSETPDLALCDGQGIAHPRRFGLACHLGVLLDVPSIGVAKSRLVGEAPQPSLEKGQKQPLVYNKQRVGWLLRSRTGVKPLYISPGHKVSISKCWEPVLTCCTKFRLPEPIRIADKLSKTRT